MNCKAVFFDLDDTLCHAAQAWRKAEQDTFDSLMLYSYPGSTELGSWMHGESGNPSNRTSLHNWTIICS